MSDQAEQRAREIWTAIVDAIDGHTDEQIELIIAAALREAYEAGMQGPNSQRRLKESAQAKNVEIRAQLATTQAENERLRAGWRRLIDEVEQTDHEAKRYSQDEDGDAIIVFYEVLAGQWHHVLAAARDGVPEDARAALASRDAAGG